MQKMIHIELSGSVAILSPVQGMEGELAECADILDALEFQLCNGWDNIAPEECGALTGGLIISDEAERDDHGNLVKLGRVLWDADYAVRDALESICTEGEARFIVAA